MFLKYEKREAIIWKKKSFSYGELLKKISKWSLNLEKNNIKSGTVIAVNGDFTPNSISLLFSLIKKKCIIVPINNPLTKLKKEIFAICKPEFEYKINDTDEVQTKKTKLYSDYQLYQILRKNNHSGIILFSSGSSGKPKAAVHNLDNLLEKFTKIKKSYRTLNFLIFDHWGGLNTMFHTLANGGILVFTKERHPENICKLIEKNRIELLPVTPTFLNLLLLSGAHKKYDLSSLKIVSYGTEPMPQTLLDKLNIELPNIKFQQTFGLIEVGVLRTKSKNNKSLWVKMEGNDYQLRVVKGILQIKSKSNMLGYLNAKSPFTKDGWFVTGDIVKEKNGFFKILGRESDIINVGGEKAYPAEVENIIQQIPNVSEVIVYGEPNSLMGNIVCAKIRLFKEQSEIEFKRELRKYCLQKLQKFKIPVKIHIVTTPLITSRFKKIKNQV